MSPSKETRELIEYAEEVARAMLEDMDGEECVDMVRQFCSVMADWQPNIKENLDDPMMLGLHCLAAAELFKLAFVKGYAATSKRIDAQNAIKKAFES